MLREQRILERMINELGEELNEYIKTFYICDLWRFKENELIVNKTFKRVVGIIADFNLTTVDEVLSHTFKLIESNEAMLHILGYLCDECIKKGNESVLNRAMVLCYCLFILTKDTGKTATMLLQETLDSYILTTKTTWLTKLKYYLRINKYPYEFKGDPDALLLITILKGKPVYDTVDYIATVKGIN